MRCVFLNVYKGAREQERFDLLVEFAHRYDPDVLCLSELNEWEEDSRLLREFKRRTGYEQHCFARSRSGYHLGVFSNHGLHEEVVDVERFRTALLKVRVQGEQEFTLLLLHLNSRSEQLRLQEIDVALEHAEQDDVVLLGDLNSLSPQDEYDEQFLRKRMRETGLYKFGEQEVRTAVIQRILDFGLVDAASLFPSEDGYTVPTAANEDEAHFQRLRLDYVFLTERLSSQANGFSVLRDDITKRLSDHYPVMVDLFG